MGKYLFRVRTAAYRRQSGRCFYCRVLMWTDDCAAFAARHALPARIAKWLQCTAEHLRARCDGGRDVPGNIVAACRLCNHRRHAQRKVAPPPTEYQARVQRRIKHKRWHDPQVFQRGLI